MTNPIVPPHKAVVMIDIDENGAFTGIHTTHPIRVVLRSQSQNRPAYWSIADVTPAEKSPEGQHHVDLSHVIAKIPNGFQFTMNHVTWRTDNTAAGWQAYDASDKKLPFSTPDKNTPTPEDIQAAGDYLRKRNAPEAG